MFSVMNVYRCTTIKPLHEVLFSMQNPARNVNATTTLINVTTTVRWTTTHKTVQSWAEACVQGVNITHLGVIVKCVKRFITDRAVAR